MTKSRDNWRHISHVYSFPVTASVMYTTMRGRAGIKGSAPFNFIGLPSFFGLHLVFVSNRIRRMELPRLESKHPKQFEANVNAPDAKWERWVCVEPAGKLHGQQIEYGETRHADVETETYRTTVVGAWRTSAKLCLIHTHDAAPTLALRRYPTSSPTQGWQ